MSWKKTSEKKKKVTSTGFEPVSHPWRLRNVTTAPRYSRTVGYVKKRPFEQRLFTSVNLYYARNELNDYVLLCEQHAIALRNTQYITKYYCMSSFPLPYGIRVTTFTWLRMTVWAACPCPTAYVLLLLHDYVRLCEQLALAVRHMHYYY